MVHHHPIAAITTDLSQIIIDYHLSDLGDHDGIDGALSRCQQFCVVRGDEEIDELPSLMVAFHSFKCLALALAAIDDRDTVYSWVRACTYAMIRSILGVLTRVPVDLKAKVVLFDLCMHMARDFPSNGHHKPNRFSINCRNLRRHIWADQTFH